MAWKMFTLRRLAARRRIQKSQEKGELESGIGKLLEPAVPAVPEAREAHDLLNVDAKSVKEKYNQDVNNYSTELISVKNVTILQSNIPLGILSRLVI